MNKRIIALLSIVFFILFLALRTCTSIYEKGKDGYTKNCANCHMEQGEGVVNLFPPLSNSDYLNKYFDQLPCIIRNGMKGPIIVNGNLYNDSMVAFPELSVIEITNIINYMNEKWGNKNKIYFETIKQKLDSCDFNKDEN